MEQLRDVNERLVLAVLQSQVDADTAKDVLNADIEAARRDPLTALPNRTLLMDRFAHDRALARRHGSRVAILFVDLNRFKQVNDTLGHTIGDHVLRRVAETLLSCVRSADTVSRYGGDEFVILLSDLEDLAAAVTVAEKIAAALNVPWREGEHLIRLSASIGISIFPDDADSEAALINLADAAMYRAKGRGAGGFVVHGAQVSEGDVIDPQLLSALQTPIAHTNAVQQETERRYDALRDANQNLVFSVLAAMAMQESSELAQTRQRDFIAMLAHELRGPLAPLRNVSAMLANAAPDAALLPRLHQILERQIKHMARMVDDLLDVARAVTGKLQLVLAPVDLRVVVLEAVEACRAAMDLRLQQFSVTLPPRPVFVDGDHIRLTQIICNLLDNASKYTPVSGAIRLTLVETDREAVITVTDTGIGVATREIPRVAGLFTQNARAIPSSDAGLGIGLTVVHELVQAHGGIVVSHPAEAGVGSTFEVTLPLLAAKPLPAPAAPESAI